MRPDYDGIKFYGQNDMSIGWELEDSEEKLQGISSESKILFVCHGNIPS